jgi:hypothetical protein
MRNDQWIMARAGGRTAVRFIFSMLMLALPFAEAHAQISINPIYRDSWQGWENLGSNTYDAPECLSTKPNRIDCFTVGYGAAISRIQWDGSLWRNWEAVNGMVPSNYVGNYILPLRMECVSWAADHIDCFTRGSTGALMRRTWDGAYDHGWQNLNGVLASMPDCVSTEPRRIDCFARWPTGGLGHIRFNGDTWSNWVTYPGNIAEGTKPECVAYVGGRVECVALWPDYTLRHFSLHNPLRGFQALPYPAVAALTTSTNVPRTPVCRTEPGTSNLACFSPWSVWIEAENRLAQSFGMWTYDIGMDRWAFTDLNSDFGKSFSSQPTGLMGYDFDCVARAGGRVDCIELVVRQPLPIQTGGTKTQLLRQMSINQGAASGWSNYNLASAASPRPGTLGCVSWAADRLDCFAGGSGYDPSPLWHAWFVPAATFPILKRF